MKIYSYSCDLSQDPKSIMKHQANQRWETLNIMSEKCSSNTQCIFKNGDKALIAVDGHQHWHRLVDSPVLRPVSTTATHTQIILRGISDTTHFWCPIWKNWWIFSGIYWIDCFELSPVIPWRLKLPRHGEKPKSSFSMLTFMTKQTVIIVQMCPRFFPLLVIIWGSLSFLFLRVT